MDIALKMIWSSQLPLAVFFIVLDLKTGFDRSFRYFGLALLFLCGMTGIDLWILPSTPDPSGYLRWTGVMFTVGCLFAVFYFWYMAELTGWRRAWPIRILGAYAACLSMLFLAGAMLRMEAGAIRRTWLYDACFPPFMGICLVGAVALILRKMRASPRDRKVLLFHLLGFTLLFTFGVLDVVFTWYLPKPFFVSFNTLGALAFGVSMSFIFLERLISLLREKDSMHGQVKAAVRELHEAFPMRRMGESVLMLNHEIKNYLGQIKGNVALLGSAPLPPESAETIARVRRAADGLDRLSRDVLELPGAVSLAEREPVRVHALIRAVRDGDFPGKADAVVLPDSDAGWTVEGDPEKLRLVFVNLIKNAFEAGAGRVEIRLKEGGGQVLVIGVEDDGEGCDPRRLPEIGKAFHTTKRGTGGSGLGICVVRAVLEGHGGSLGLYAKNGSGFGTGLVANVVLPSLFPDPAGTKALAVIAEEPANRLGLLGLCRNLYQSPFQAMDGAELDALRKRHPGLVVLADGKAFRGLRSRAPWLPTVLESGGNGIGTLWKSGEVRGRSLMNEELLADCLAGG